MQLASSLSFDETEAGNVGLVATEAAKNLLKHAGGGDMVIRAVEHAGLGMVEMLAIDKGPGIADLERSFEDGYSTAGTPGTGLGAISRVATFHDIYTRPRQGTALLVRMGRRGAAARRALEPNGRFLAGAVSVPKPGEQVNGDAWSFRETAQNGGRLVMADGLGHGLLAADASRAAVRVSDEDPREPGPDLMRRIHEALRPTRGAAVAIANLHSANRTVQFTGVGNISASIISPDGIVRHAVSHPGTAGHELRRIAEFQYPWEPGSTLIMHSDGVLSHWSLEPYPGLLSRHPALIAGILYRDFSRGRDDATIAVVRDAETE
jgi:anti-sigma regulatory factor (Ser/Thr protein kinase)